MTASPPRSVLYIRPDSIGDLVIFSSALSQLLKAWPQARHTLVVRPGYESLAPLFPPQVRWQVLAINPFNQHPGGSRGALAAHFRDLEALAPDLILAPALNRTWLEVAIAAHFPAARRVALGRRRVEPYFSQSLRLELGVEPSAAFEEIVPADEHKFDWDNNHRIVDHLLERSTPRVAPCLEVPPDARLRAKTILAEKNLPIGDFVALFVGGVANVPIKAWPASKFAQLVLWIQHERKLPILLLGQAMEARAIAEVQEGVRELGGISPPAWLGQDGEVTLLAGLLGQSRCYVGHDTGAMHLAAAVGRPVVGIFGGGHWPRFRPIGQQVVSVVQPLPCFGCNWDCCFSDAPCVKTIAVTEVARAVELILDSGPGSFDHVLESRNLSEETANLIRAVIPRYAAVQKDRFERQHAVEEYQREVAIKDMEIAGLKRELEVKDRKSVALASEVAAKDLHIRNLEAMVDFGRRRGQRAAD